MSRDDGGKVTPVPIPNTEVKLSSADGTWTAGSRESRTSRGNMFEEKDLIHCGSGLFFCFDLEALGFEQVGFPSFGREYRAEGTAKYGLVDSQLVMDSVLVTAPFVVI